MLGLGSYGFWEPWEPKYALAIQEMLDRGEYFIPYLNGEIRWTKPILYYWAALPLAAVAGVNEWTMRLPSALAALAGMIVLYLCISRIRSRRTGFLAAMILGTTPQYFCMARQAMPDMLMSFFLLSTMCFFAAGRFGEGDPRRWFQASYASLGLAFLTKGPVTLVLALGAIGICFLFQPGGEVAQPLRTFARDWKIHAKRFHVLPGLIIAGAIAVPWYLFLMATEWRGFWAIFVGYENFARFVLPIRDHHGTVTYYFSTIFHGMYPWSALLPGVLIFLMKKTGRTAPEMRQRWYFAAWFLSAFLLYSAAGTKLQHYFLPAAAPFAVLIASFWEDFSARKRPTELATVLISVPFLYIISRDLLDEGHGRAIANFIDRSDLNVEGIPFSLLMVFGTWTAACATAFLSKRASLLSRRVALICVMTAVFNAAVFSLHVIPRHTTTGGRNVTVYTSKIEKRLQKGAALVVFGGVRYSAYYYIGRDKVAHYEGDELDTMVASLHEKSRVYIIAQDEWMPALHEKLALDRRHKWKTLSSAMEGYSLIRGLRRKAEIRKDSSVAAPGGGNA